MQHLRNGKINLKYAHIAPYPKYTYQNKIALQYNIHLGAVCCIEKKIRLYIEKPDQQNKILIRGITLWKR